MENMQHEGRRPRKRFFVRKAAELVRSVKLSGEKAQDAGNHMISAAARQFDALFTGNTNQIQLR